MSTSPLFGALLSATSCHAAPATPAPAAIQTPAASQAPATETIAEVVDIAPVWAGHSVGFKLLSHGDRQFVAFYDAERNMTIGQRTLGEKGFRLTRLPTKVVWDSHNYIDMAIDDDGYLHVSGNMHVVPLIYFRGTRPLDASSLERVPQMTGELENRMTYPRFFRGPKRELLFAYRDGGSGNGNEIYNIYDLPSRTWKRLLDQPLFDGQGQRNAYSSLPALGPDGYYHVLWVWRESPDASSNHDPSYARSRDLVHWENSRGEALKLPITLGSGDIVDAVPEKGGVINGNLRLGFDDQKRLIVSYHKYDAKGNTQIYSARLEEGKWKIYQTSDWNYRWDFGGGGTLVFDVSLGGVQARENGVLTQTFRNKKDGAGTWILDPRTLKPTGLLPAVAAYPPSIARVESKWPEMGVLWAGDSGKSDEAGVRYVLRWETLPANRDRPRDGPLPPASMLRVYKLQKVAG